MERIREEKGRGAQTPGTMYPRVKVREKGEQITFQEETRVLLMRVFETLSVEEDTSSSVHMETPAIHPPHARITESHHSHLAVPSISNRPKTSGKSSRHAANDDDDNKPNIRASSVPRPRAVLSSPDNDGMIGSINKRSTLLKTRKPVARNVRQSPVDGVKASKEGSNSSNPMEKNSSGLKATRQRLPVKKEKVNTIRI